MVDQDDVPTGSMTSIFDGENDGSPYLDDIARSIIGCVRALEETSTFLTEAARIFAAQAASFADDVRRLKAVAGFLTPHPSEQ